MIGTAAHEVQKPVFFARIIIIVSYLPIFTLQRVEGRLFRPMAWTVAFALLGRPAVRSSNRSGALHLPVQRPNQGVEKPCIPLVARELRPSVGLVFRSSEAHVGNRRAWPWRSWCFWASAASSDRNFCLTSTKARSGCAARWRRAPDLRRALRSRERHAGRSPAFPRSNKS